VVNERAPSSRWMRALRAAIGLLGVTAALSLFWLGAHYGVSWVLARVGIHLGAAASQVVASFVGLLLFGSLVGVIGSRHREREADAWHQLLDGLRRIAEGDFAVRLPTPPVDFRHPYGQLIHNVNDMASELDRLERMRQDFIASVSHEIQSPLTSIGGFARALREDDPEPETRQRYLSILQTEVERLSRLSDHLLRLTALESEGHRLDLQAFRLDTQLQRAVLACEPQWTRKALDMAVTLDPVTVTADEALLDQVWSNLLHNAIKFTPAGGAIAVRARRAGERVTVSVEDTGIGIASEDQERVFERFFKGDRSRNRDLGGSGLGLALVRRIVDLHGGRLWLESAPGEGTRVSVALPLATRPSVLPAESAVAS